MNKTIQVSLDAGSIAISEGGRIVRSIRDFAVGRPGHETPTFGPRPLSIERQAMHISHKYPPPNGGAQMPFALFFDPEEGDAFHQGDVRTPSHGCVHLQESDAKWLFDWAGHDAVEVSIQGTYPKNPLYPQD